MSAFLAALLAAIGPLLIEALQALLKSLLDKWKQKPEAAAILAEANTPEKLHAAMPKLLDIVAGDFGGPLNLVKRLRFNRLKARLEKRPVTDAVWDHMILNSGMAGEPTGVSYIEVFDAVQ